MIRKETTSKLSKLVEALINPDNDPRKYTAREVTFDYGRQTQVRVDYMSFHPRTILFRASNKDISSVMKSSLRPLIFIRQMVTTS